MLAIGAAVGGTVTAAHQLVDGGDPRLWMLFHAAMPAIVLALGAWSAGGRRPGRAGVLRGAVVVAAVVLAFGWINRQPVPFAVTLLLNFLVPLTVSTLGAVLASAAVPAGPLVTSSPES